MNGAEHEGRRAATPAGMRFARVAVDLHEQEAKRRAAEEELAAAAAAGARTGSQNTQANAVPSTNTGQSHFSIDVQKKYMDSLEKKLNEDIGFYYWKRYTTSAFWANISLPINLTITFLTALTAAQANTESLIPQQLFANLSIASLIITTLNTFFRPHAQMTAAAESMQKWNAIGIEFETAYFSDIDKDYTLSENIDMATKQYLVVQGKVNDLRKDEGVGAINFLTDFIHMIIFSTCARRYKVWLPKDRMLADEVKPNPPV